MADHPNEELLNPRLNNIRVVGLAHKKGEDCLKLADTLFRDKFRMGYVKLEWARRDGPDIKGKPQHLVMKLGCYQDKIQILQRQRQALANDPFYCVDDLQDDADTESPQQFGDSLSDDIATHLTLVIGLILYLLVGSVVFVAVEGINDVPEKDIYETCPLIKHQFNKLKVEEYHALKGELHAVLNTVDERYRHKAIETYEKYTLLAEKSYLEDLSRTSGSVLFCATIFFVGHKYRGYRVVPVTIGGKVSTIVYFVIGILLLMVFTFDAIIVLVEVVIKVTEMISSSMDYSPVVVKVFMCVSLILLYMMMMYLIDLMEEIDKEAMYVTYVSLMTTGLGDLTPEQHHLGMLSFLIGWLIRCYFAPLIGLMFSIVIVDNALGHN